MKKSLHRLIPDKELPFPLRQPLVFGNRDQINAFSALESDIELMETRQAKIAAGGLRHFDVRIEYTGTQNFRVLAIDKADAEERASAEADLDEVGIEIDTVSAWEVRPKKKTEQFKHAVLVVGREGGNFGEKERL